MVNGGRALARPAIGALKKAGARAYLSVMSGGGLRRGNPADMQSRLRAIFDANGMDSFKAGETTPLIPCLYNCKAGQPRSSEKNAASRAGQTPCARWAVGICYTRARKSETAEDDRAFEEKARLSEPIEPATLAMKKDYSDLWLFGTSRLNRYCT